MGMVLLHHASVHNHVSVKVLLEYGADREIKDNKGKTVMDWAKQSNRRAVVQLLDSEPISAAGKKTASTKGMGSLGE